MLLHLIFRTALRKNYCDPCFINGEMETKDIKQIFFLLVGIEIKELDLEKAA